MLSERLKYYNTALKFYTKALRYTFSKFVHMRKLKIFAKLKDYKNYMNHLVQFLTFIPLDQFKVINKTPSWLDKALLRVLGEHNSNEILSWIVDASKPISEFIKKMFGKYKIWIDKGQDLHLFNSK
jgi:hypothetical protein